MTIRWLLLRASSLPNGDDWLGPDERRVLAGLKLQKRRTDWRLGRLVAKHALGACENVDRFDRIQIIAAEDGAPEAFIDGQKVASSISISHRDGVAACVVAPDARVGCDLEAVEPRTLRFVNDFFTDRERVSLEGTPAALRDRRVALTWSAKESALKVLRVGLRRDTRSVEVEVGDPEAAGGGWHPFSVMVSPENRRLHGWWRDAGGVVLTVASDEVVSAQPSEVRPQERLES